MIKCTIGRRKKTRILRMQKQIKQLERHMRCMQEEEIILKEEEDETV